jgi:hypothetical protein
MFIGKLLAAVFAAFLTKTYTIYTFPVSQHVHALATDQVYVRFSEIVTQVQLNFLVTLAVMRPIY